VPDQVYDGIRDIAGPPPVPPAAASHQKIGVDSDYSYSVMAP